MGFSLSFLQGKVKNMEINFDKMHGIGNDFILLHGFAKKAIDSLQPHVAFLCDRRVGIGADGVIFIEESDIADFQMRIINSDGSEAEMCGNGIRCLARYIYLHGLSNKDSLKIETKAGVKETFRDGEMIRVNMGAPTLQASKIPVNLTSDKVVNYPLMINSRQFNITAVSMGNPHAVIYENELSDELVLGYGPIIEKHQLFPKKVNVEFVSVLDPSTIQIRVFERGCGETFACGTGACASVVSGVLNGLHKKDIIVKLRGGDLQISWDGDVNSPVYMTGPAQFVFSGKIEISI